MSFLLFPGRHLLQTTFQEEYLNSIVQTPLNQLSILAGSVVRVNEPVDSVIFAVTSANHQFSRYNPIPFHVRAIGIDRFASRISRDFDIRYRIFGIPHFAPTPRFATYILKEIAEQTEGEIDLTPQNCLVLTSTLALSTCFQMLGFAILPAEAAQNPQPSTPQHLLFEVMEAGETWKMSPEVRARIVPETFTLWRDFPEVPRRIFRLWNDPILNDEGSLTATRNYSTYAQAMGNEVVSEIKYNDIKAHILPGRIVDEGCADGALLVRIASDFADSDLIGIEITGELLARCLERQRAGEYGEAFIYFHQRNLTTPIFRSATIHTTICNSTIHELWSYNQGEKTVMAYLGEKLRQLAPGGRLIIRDVVGPENADEPVYLWLRKDDGVSWESNTAESLVEGDIGTLSTYARFFRFARDFLPQRRADRMEPQTEIVPFSVATIDQVDYIVTTLRLATEFIAKKDYVVNWASEMHEEFAYWSFSKWNEVLTSIGFVVNRISHVYTNPWILEKRWQDQVALFALHDAELHPLPFPPTTVVLIAEKPKLPVA